jgi:O-antigen/teichoic acid export membrane protein
MTQRQKHSLILGGLTSSLGIFISKAIGILYVSPFTLLATEQNLAYYARAYNVYEIVLNLSIAGLPFAIATLVAKYHLKEAYKTVLLVRRLSQAILALLGFFAMLIVFFLALPIARISVASTIDTLEVIRTRNVLMIMALAVFVVPLLNSYRGFYQGLKELKTYAFSQVFEQLARVSFLLGMGFLLVYVFRFDAIWAIYAAIASTSISAIASIIYFINKDRQVLKEIREKAAHTQEVLPSKKELTQELFFFAIPFLLNVFLNNSNNFINILFFNRGMLAYGATLQEADLYYSMVMFTTNKLTSIPQVIAPGFITAIIPYVTAAFEQKNHEQLQRYVIDTIDTVFYITLPLAFFLFGISDKIYYVMYGGEYLSMGSEVLRFNAITGLTFNLAASSNALMMALRLRKQNLTISALAVLFKFIVFVPFMVWLGYGGSIASNALNHIILFILNLYLISRAYQLNYFKSFQKVFLMLLGLLVMQLSFFTLESLGLSVVDHGRWFGLLELMVYGIIGTLVYIVATSVMKLPQSIFNFNYSDIIKRFKRT